VEEADHLRHHQDVKHIYAKRKETFERVGENSKGISKGVQNFLIPNPFCLQTENSIL
jgi:hypothetical protein